MAQHVFLALCKDDAQTWNLLTVLKCRMLDEIEQMESTIEPYESDVKPRKVTLTSKMASPISKESLTALENLFAEYQTNNPNFWYTQ